MASVLSFSGHQNPPPSKGMWRFAKSIIGLQTPIWIPGPKEDPWNPSVRLEGQRKGLHAGFYFHVHIRIHTRPTPWPAIPTAQTFPARVCLPRV